MKEYITHSGEETVAVGRKIAAGVRPPALVLLRGDLGAGKTTMAKGMISAWDAGAPDDVTSPTFTLVHEYASPTARIYHIDLYRVDTPRELQTLGLDDLMDAHSILLMEWGEKFPRFARERDLEILIEHLGADDRRITVRE